MIDWPAIIRCPACRQGALTCEGVCAGCAARYPIIEGILDLRTGAGEQTPRSENERLILENPDWDYETLIREIFRRYSGPLADYYAAYQLDEIRGQRMGQLFQSASTAPCREMLLDVACGSGVLLGTGRSLYRWIIGVDILLEQLLYARRRLRGQEADNVILVCADAYDLPVFPEAVDGVWSLNTLEHLLRIEDFIREVARVLKPGGYFVGDSRNRFDLFFPEPHVKLRWVGFLPRRWQRYYIALFQGRRRAESYVEDTRLRSIGEITSLARRHFRRSAVRLPDVTAYGMSPAISRVVERAGRITLLRSLMRLFFPTFLLIGEK